MILFIIISFTVISVLNVMLSTAMQLGLHQDMALRYGKWGKSLPFRGDRACLQALQIRLFR